MMARRSTVEPAVPSRLRFLLVVEATFAGVGRHVLDLAGGLLDRGHDVDMIYSPLRMEPRFDSERARLELRGLRAAIVPMVREPSPRDLGAMLAIRRYIKRVGPFDVVHGHSSKAGALARLAAIGVQTQRVYTPHAFRTLDPTLRGPSRALYGAIEAVLGRAASDRIICVSTHEYRHARGWAIPASRLAMIPNAVQIPGDVPDRATAQRRFGLDDGDDVVVWVGRLAPQKAPLRFVDLMRRLVAHHPSARGLIIGFGPLEAEVSAAIARHKLEARVQLVTDSRSWEGFAAGDVAAITSLYEGDSLVALEAAASGLEVVWASTSPDEAVVELARILTARRAQELRAAPTRSARVDSEQRLDRLFRHYLDLFGAAPLSAVTCASSDNACR